MIGTMGGRSLDAAKIEAAYIGFQTAFEERLKVADPLYSKLATWSETENVLDTQLWLSSVPQMRRWIGDKQLHKLRGQSQPIVTSPFESSIEVSKHDVLYDRLGLYRKKINGLADAYIWALDAMTIAMLAAGVAGAAGGVTYDGANLIDTVHKAVVGASNQSNRVTGALSATTYATAWQRFYELKDDQGNPLNIPGKMYLVVGPANRQVARTILNQDIQAAGARNIDFGTAELVVHQRLTAGTLLLPNGASITLTGTEWFLVPEGSASLLGQIRRGPQLLAVDNPNDSKVFMTGNFQYGIEAEFGAAYGLWQEIVGGPGV